jgi:hypothetical protein
MMMVMVKVKKVGDEDGARKKVGRKEAEEMEEKERERETTMA